MTAAGRALPAVLALLVAASAAAAWFALGRDEPKPDKDRYRTEAVDRGTIVRQVSANGTLNPVVLVNVGTQVSGTVRRLHLDFNSRVLAGQVLAELDPALFEAALRQSEANVQNALASLELARIRHQRTERLVGRSFIAAQELDVTAQQLAAAEAQVALARAQVKRDRTNLEYTVIRSPVSGVVVARSVDTGQTVAASFQTPTLFQIARDLKEMQIDTSVAEADVGQIRAGQSVGFTVDAFPEREFTGEVRQVRLNPTIQQNVVTYNVVIGVRNEDEVLMPGMTAHVNFTVGRRDNVLRVPSAALRYRPGGEDGPRPPGVVYRLEGGEPVAVKVRTGVSDGSRTEVAEGLLREGDLLVVRETRRRDSGQSFRIRLF